MNQRVSVLGMPVDALTMDETIDRIERLIDTDPATVHQHVVINAAKVVAAQDDGLLHESIASASIINADGMSIVWASRLLGTPVPERVAGIDLMDRLVTWAADTSRSVYLLGATSEVVEGVAQRLLATHPSLLLAGRRDGYWSPAEEAAVVAEIAAVDADLLFVALPSPSKELFINQYRNRLNVSLVMGVGGAFDVIAGLTRRAPQWMQSCGLEWLFRMLQEPRRMLRRYVVGNLAFLLLLVKAMLQRQWSTLKR
jgi:N-acetylglucosaminyldiphosphoundecaprenol N-acetyl-beta-D-mannosaminyltransferase